MVPQTLNREVHDDRDLIERLTRIETQFEAHMRAEEAGLRELKHALDEVRRSHEQARGGARMLAIIIAVLSALGGAWAWVKAYVVLR